MWVLQRTHWPVIVVLSHSVMTSQATFLVLIGFEPFDCRSHRPDQH